MSSNGTSLLTNAKRKINNSIIITGIYVVTATSYNLVRDPSFVSNNFIMNTIDMVLTEPLVLTLGALIPTTMIVCNVVEYRKIKKENLKTIIKKK